MAGQEYKVEKVLRVLLDTNEFMPFIPINERLFKKSGIIKKEFKPLFPGYVFVESNVPGQEFIQFINSLKRISMGNIKTLKYSETEISMKESEKKLLLSLCNDSYCIESSSGIIIGDKIHITAGPLIGYESIVKKVNRHKREAYIEMDIMGCKRLVSISLEILSKL